MGKEIKVWFDKEGDYLEVIFEKKAGYFNPSSTVRHSIEKIIDDSSVS